MDTLYILLPVHNRREITRRFITCLKSQTFQDYHLVLIDDGSTDGTQEMVSSEVSALTIITGRGNWWWAGALQQGYEWLCQQKLGRSDLVLIINDDTEFTEDFLACSMDLVRGKRQQLLLTPSYSRETGRLMSGGMWVDWRKLKFSQVATDQEVNCLSTRGLFLAAEDFLKLGGFYPRLLPHYLSDYEFTVRAFRRGMNLKVADELRLMVDEEMTGFHEFSEMSFKDFLKNYFGRKSDANPFAWTMFIALACPWPWKMISWMRVWYGTLIKLMKAMSS